MRWILGVDVGARSRGAVQFARWLARETRGGDELVAVHVLGADHPPAVVVEAAHAAVQRELEHAWPAGAAPVVELMQAPTVADGLAGALVRHRAEGLVIGRAAATEGPHVVRLGRVARRVLRHLASPVVIAPPDVVIEELGAGAVTVFSALTDDSIDACRFAAGLAARAGRPLALAHVARAPRAGIGSQLAASTLERMAADLASAARSELSRWLESLDLRPADAAVVQGDVVSSALAFGVARRAPLLVVGSRPLRRLERLFAPSLGRRLAAVSGVPVAIVPPTTGARGQVVR